MQRTNIYLDEEQCQELDRLARARGVSRAALIRELLDQALAGAGHNLSDDLAAIDASFGVFADQEIHLERGPDERSRHLQRIAEA
jgi:metal-responsive CopG/Arc/MetJ family transcriptional regulator